MKATIDNEQTRAFVQGERACADGATLDSNPHDNGPMREAWRAGWLFEYQRLDVV